MNTFGKLTDQILAKRDVETPSHTCVDRPHVSCEACLKAALSGKTIQKKK